MNIFRAAGKPQGFKNKTLKMKNVKLKLKVFSQNSEVKC